MYDGIVQMEDIFATEAFSNEIDSISAVQRSTGSIWELSSVAVSHDDNAFYFTTRFSGFQDGGVLPQDLGMEFVAFQELVGNKDGFEQECGHYTVFVSGYDFAGASPVLQCRFDGGSLMLFI